MNYFDPGVLTEPDYQVTSDLCQVRSRRVVSQSCAECTQPAVHRRWLKLQPSFELRIWSVDSPKVVAGAGGGGQSWIE